MFCPNCGIQIPDDARFCPDCGTVITPVGTPQPAVSEPAPAPQPAPAAEPAPVSQSAPMATTAPTPTPAPAPVIPPAPSFAAPLQSDPSFASSNGSSQPPVVFIPAQKNNILCVVGFFGALASILMGGIPSLAALILSVIGLVQTKQRNERGRGLAIAGIIVSSVGVASLIIGIIIAVFVNLSK